MVSTTPAQIAARLERLPLSRVQHGMFGIIALAFFFDSMDLAMMTFLLGSIKSEFQLSSTMTGLLASTSFVGMALGAALSGLLADRFGRKPIFQISIVVWGLASLSCALSPSVEWLMISRIILGFGMGMEFPIAQSMLTELIPAQKRGRYMALLDGFWPIGFITAGLLAWGLLPMIGWRGIFLALALPALLVLIVRRKLPESPRWLAEHGKMAEAECVVDGLEHQVREALNLKELPEPAPSSAAVSQRSPSFWEAFRTLWSDQYRGRTGMVWGLWFFALLGFYGLTSWLSALLQDSGYSIVGAVSYTVMISLGGIPGFLSMAWLLDKWGRKPCCLVTLVGSACMVWVYGQCASNGVDLMWLLASGFVMQFFLFGMWAVLYTWTPELYPTSARATGSGMASAIGRVGSLIGPTVVGLVIPIAGQAGAFTLGAGCFLTAGVIVLLWGKETRGYALESITAH
ncbi:MFS transporter [Larsenimonas salina]|uniref:MFS transporter n=1 Tax=Larsenimonas salina TaxID=1295565 RepID=UPI0020736875|nr:MFS transporter [Larsenimonas salina]MCM5704489.1 MFS transporter [Larsenimonas salina]